MTLDRSFDDSGVQTAEVAVCPQKYNSRFNVHVQIKTTFLYLRHSDINETADTTGVSDERGRKTAELHTTAPNELKLDEGG